MTIEEAIEILDTIPTIGEQVDALEMAIKALQNQPRFIIHSDGTMEQIIEPSIKDIYNKGWEDGAKAAAYHYELCIEEIKAEIADFMAKIPALGNCKEGWHNAGQRIGLEQACEIIDNHIAERGDNES